ncbi:Clp protease family protein [Theileria parva strain Muguga]|uniref:Clp protease family protein n=1 Tax=Theileria parva strain Muguga TaxID=333668 RepID=UPI001C621D82|nr:Clp protease family protein [Theileria parva strain Muguga]EAN31275.2 Clp protease family protein [Theileria parva strain Muguga]
MLILKLVLILSSFLVHLSTESSGFSNYNFFHKIISPISPKKTQNSQYPVKQKIINKTTFVTGKTFFISNNYKNSTVVRPRRFYSQLLSLPSSVALKTRPPDLPSLLLSERIVYIGYPIQQTVAHLVISQLLYLDYDSQDKPIKIYINSDNERSNEDGISTSEIDALNIVDVMNYLKNEVITINLGKAYGPGALILASGTRGKRFVLPRSYTLLRQSPTTLSFRQAEDIAIYSKEILRARRSVISVFSKVCNKSEEEILEKINIGDYMGAQETVNFGLADKILENIS